MHFLHTPCYAALLSGCSWVVACIINRWSSKQNVSWSSVSCSSKLTKPEEGWSQEPLIYCWLIRNTGDDLDLWLPSEGGGARTCRTEPLTCEIWYYLCINTGTIDLNGRTPSWCVKNCLLKSRKMVQMNLLAKQKYRHRQREQMYGY